MNQSKIKVSVIVAVYQVEKYIHKCLDSIQKQTLNGFEVLLIDDGSKDNSGNICDEYAQKDGRFRVIHKENGGVSTARQVGLNNAIGEYVIHVDPDDWIEKNMLEDLYYEATASNSDMVVCDYYQEINGKSSYIKQVPNLQSNKYYFYDLINKLHGSCWNKLTRRSCFSKYNISFFPQMIMWEDLFINLQLIEQPIKISYLPHAYYHYDESTNASSAVRSWSRKKLTSQIVLIDWLEKKNDPVIAKENFELKKSAKKTAFFVKEIGSKEFRSLYPETNDSYTFRIKDIGHFDFFMYLAIHVSLRLARSLNTIKDKFKHWI